MQLAISLSSSLKHFVALCDVREEVAEALAAAELNAPMSSASSHGGSMHGYGGNSSSYHQGEREPECCVYVFMSLW